MTNNKQTHGFCKIPHKKCTLSYCDENGCIYERRNLVGEPIEMSKNKQSSVYKEFVPYEQALALKELGFDEPCFMSFNPNPNWWDNQCTNSQLNSLNGGSKIVCSSPLWQQAFRWFREKYKIEPEILSDMMGYVCSIVDRNKPLKTRLTPSNLFQTYEEAELACLRKLIEIVKQGGNK